MNEFLTMLVFESAILNNYKIKGFEHMDIDRIKLFLFPEDGKLTPVAVLMTRFNQIVHISSFGNKWDICTNSIDLGELKSTVAFPHLPENTKTIDEITEDVVIDQVVIGSCTNGRLDDLRCAAEVLKGRHVKKGLRCIIIPATQAIYLQAMEEGLLKIFIEAGAVVSTPTCGPCLGGYMGILAEGERCVSTTNRNFVGRMGHVKSEIYLASPAVAAASAVTGKISCPCQL